jgi:hypothetical protein
MLNSQGTVIAVSVGLLTAIALAFAISGYVNWSSDAAWNEFMKSASASESSTPVQQEPTGCPIGKRKLSTQITPLP